MTVSSSSLVPSPCLTSLERSVSFRDYLELAKPRVMMLVLFTGWVGLLRAPGRLGLMTSFWALVWIGIGAGSSAILNMWYERDLDGTMTRTLKRPLPQKRIHPPTAFFLGLSLAAVSVVALGVGVNLRAGLMLLFTIVFYACVYTIYLKPSTPYNIVWGGLAGALPPVIGWACVSSLQNAEPWILCAIIFLWTPPHFWALALLYQEDYKASGLPMMPNVRGAKYTLTQMRAYTLSAGLAVGVLALQPHVGWVFGIISTAYSFWFLKRAWRLSAQDHASLKRFFRDSIHYLFAIFSLLVLDYVLR